MKKTIFWGTLAGFGFLLGAISGAVASQIPQGEVAAEMPEHSMESMPRSSENAGQFQRIEQPLGNKVAVTLGGLGLIGLELWWFLFSKPKSRKATNQGGIQEVTVTVDGGYEPSLIVVQAGQSVRLNFDRKDPSSCLEEVRFPDFRIAQELMLNQVTPIEFTPDKPGRYEFSCGMNMFRGVVEAQAGDTPTAKPSVMTSQPVHSVNHSANLPSSVQATVTPDGIQEATIAVETGYQPKRVIVEAGKSVRLQFDRKNLSECYDQLLIPAFGVETALTPEQITTVEFTPEQPGEYEFLCGMKMNRGVIEVRPSQQTYTADHVQSQTHIHS